MDVNINKDEKHKNIKIESKFDKFLKVVFLIICVCMVVFLLGSAIYEELFTHIGRLELMFIDNLSDIYDKDEVKTKNFFNSSWFEPVDKVMKDNKDLELINISNISTLARNKTRVFDTKAIISFLFSQNQFIRGSIEFEEDYINPNFYINDYKRVKEILINGYGEPVIDEEIWHDDKYKNNPDEHGQALNLGDLEYMTKWETESTDIYLYLYKSDDFSRGILNVISYYPKDYFSDEESGDEEDIKIVVENIQSVNGEVNGL